MAQKTFENLIFSPFLVKQMKVSSLNYLKLKKLRFIIPIDIII